MLKSHVTLLLPACLFFESSARLPHGTQEPFCFARDRYVEMWGLTSRWQMLLDKHQWLVRLTSSYHRRPDLAGKTLELRSQPAAAAGLATSTSATSVIHVTRVSWKFRFAHATGKGLGRHLGVLCDLNRKASETLFLESDSNTKSRTLECVYK